MIKVYTCVCPDRVDIGNSEKQSQMLFSGKRLNHPAHVFANGPSGAVQFLAGGPGIDIGDKPVHNSFHPVGQPVDDFGAGEIRRLQPDALGGGEFGQAGLDVIPHLAGAGPVIAEAAARLGKFGPDQIDFPYPAGLLIGDGLPRPDAGAGLRGNDSAAGEDANPPPGQPGS